MPTKDRLSTAISLADQVLSREKKAEQARANGAKSLGPKTEQGKAKSSQNALKHGLTAAKHLRLPDDEENAYEEFLSRMLTALNPRGDLQQYFAERAIDCMWRLRRIPALEANLLHAETLPPHTKRLAYNFSHVDWPLAHLHICRYEATLERALKNALKELKELQNEPSPSPEPPMQRNAEPGKSMQSNTEQLFTKRTQIDLGKTIDLVNSKKKPRSVPVLPTDILCSTKLSWNPETLSQSIGMDAAGLTSRSHGQT